MRLFMAIDLTPAVRDELNSAITRMRRDCPEGKWVKTANLHLTLKFLGDVEADLVPEITKAVAGVCMKWTPFNCCLTHLGTFPPRGKPRILYVATDQEKRLTALAGQIEEVLAPLGFAPEGRFKSHITLARFRQPPPARFRPADIHHICFKSELPVSGVSLIQSRLSRDGASYEELCSFPFRDH